MSKEILCLGGVLGLLALAPSSALALPPNPERPLRAGSCSEALARVKEAELGSPLVGSDENRQHLLAAEAQAKRVCIGDGTVDPGKQPPRQLPTPKR